jgi:CRP-like cAMP-binding protein
MNSSIKSEQSNETSSSRISEDLELLRYSQLFSGLHLDVVKLFAYLSPHRSFKKGAPITVQGRDANEAYIIISGSIDITVEHRGRQITLQRLEKDSFFGELALLARFKWFFGSQAAEDVDVIVIDRGAFQKVIEKYPEYKDKLIERIIQLRVDRLAKQTVFMLDKMIEPSDTAEMSL